MNITRTAGSVSNVVATPLFFVVIAFLLLVCDTNQSHAQGRLRDVSKAVRKNSPQPAAPKETPPGNSSALKIDPPRKSSPPKRRPARNDNARDDHKSNDRHDDHGSQSNRYRKPSTRPRQNNNRHDSNHHHHGSRSTGVIFVAPPVTYVEPVVVPVFHACPPVHRPVVVEPFIEQPIPVMEPFIVDQPQMTNRPVYESVADLSVSEIQSEQVMIEPIIFEDWFQCQTSTLWATVGSDFDGITSGGIGARLQAPASLGLEGSVMTLRESFDGYRDHLWIGDVNLTYEILNRQDVRGRIGLGVNWLNDAWGAEAGFNLTGGIDLRLTDHLTLALESDVGNLGDADFFHARANLARRFDNVELMLGVDHFNIGGAEVNSVFSGMQLRF